MRLVPFADSWDSAGRKMRGFVQNSFMQQFHICCRSPPKRFRLSPIVRVHSIVSFWSYLSRSRRFISAQDLCEECHRYSSEDSPLSQYRRGKALTRSHSLSSPFFILTFPFTCSRAGLNFSFQRRIDHPSLTYLFLDLPFSFPDSLNSHYRDKTPNLDRLTPLK